MNKHLRSVLSGVIALLLLIPVPALGLNFLGTWRFFESVSGIASTSSFDGIDDYGLMIGMGKVEAPSSVTKLSVTATRDFQITSPSELIHIAHSFGTWLQDGSINVNLTIQRYGVANDPFNFPPYSFLAPAAAGLTHPTLDNFFKQSSLTQGLYRLSITITYTRKDLPTSHWDNSSPHVFYFRGM